MKIIDIIEDKSVMEFSKYLFDMNLVGGSEDEEETIKRLIKEKLEINHTKGICCHNSGYLCEHRREYFIKALMKKLN